MDERYLLIREAPGPDAYRRLRDVAGLSPKSAEAAAAGLANTWFGVTVLHEGQAVGMGRIVGDGGCFFQIVDMAVAPEHQGRGLGKMIMQALLEEYDARARHGLPVAHRGRRGASPVPPVRLRRDRPVVDRDVPPPLNGR